LYNPEVIYKYNVKLTNRNTVQG